MYPSVQENGTFNYQNYVQMVRDRIV